MDIKQYVRNGLLQESQNYKTVLTLDGISPSKILVVLEGKCRRKMQLGPKRSLYVNYYANSCIGLEDYLLGFSRKGAVGVYPGAYYCIWEAADCSNSLTLYPELARRFVFELSRQIRICNAQLQKTDINLHQGLESIEFGDPEADISDILFGAHFSDDEKFPPELVEKLSHKYAPGEYLMRQGEKSYDLHIILSGELEIFQESREGRKKVGALKKGDMAGEMAQFDGLPRSADVIAKEETETLVFLPENFSLLFQLHPQWSEKILNILAARLEQKRKEFETIDLQLLAGYKS